MTQHDSIISGLFSLLLAGIRQGPRTNFSSTGNGISWMASAPMLNFKPHEIEGDELVRLFALAYSLTIFGLDGQDYLDYPITLFFFLPARRIGGDGLGLGRGRINLLCHFIFSNIKMNGEEYFSSFRQVYELVSYRPPVAVSFPPLTSKNLNIKNGCKVWWSAHFRFRNGNE